MSCPGVMTQNGPKQTGPAQIPPVRFFFFFCSNFEKQLTSAAVHACVQYRQSQDMHAETWSQVSSARTTFYRGTARKVKSTCPTHTAGSRGEDERLQLLVLHLCAAPGPEFQTNHLPPGVHMANAKIQVLLGFHDFVCYLVCYKNLPTSYF